MCIFFIIKEFVINLLKIVSHYWSETAVFALNLYTGIPIYNDEYKNKKIGLVFLTAFELEGRKPIVQALSL